MKSKLYNYLFKNPLFEAELKGQAKVDYIADELNLLMADLDDVRHKALDFIRDKSKAISNKEQRESFRNDLLEKATVHFREKAQNFMQKELGAQKLGAGDYRVAYAIDDDLIVKLYLPNEYSKSLDPESALKYNDNLVEVQTYLENEGLRKYSPKLYSWDKDMYNWVMWERVYPKDINALSKIQEDVVRYMMVLDEQFMPIMDKLFFTRLEEKVKKYISRSELGEMIDLVYKGQSGNLVKNLYGEFLENYTALRDIFDDLEINYGSIEKYALKMVLTRMHDLESAFAALSKDPKWQDNKALILNKINDVEESYTRLMISILINSELYMILIEMATDPKKFGGYVIDIHSGNVVVDEKTNRLILIDFGQQYV